MNAGNIFKIVGVDFIQEEGLIYKSDWKLQKKRINFKSGRGTKVYDGYRCIELTRKEK